MHAVSQLSLSLLSDKSVGFSQTPRANESLLCGGDSVSDHTSLGRGDLGTDPGVMHRHKAQKKKTLSIDNNAHSTSLQGDEREQPLKKPPLRIFQLQPY